MASTNRMFHVVCRDCRVESLVDTETDAERLVERHLDEADHRIEFDRVA